MLRRSAFRFPAVADLPAGTYRLQAVLNRYETFELSTGHTVKLPPDKGEGQQWNRKPGNLYSEPTLVPDRPEREADGSTSCSTVKSRRSSPRPTRSISATCGCAVICCPSSGAGTCISERTCCVPEGFDEHPEAEYPLMVFHGHFPSDFGGFRTEPPDPDMECEYSERFSLDCYNQHRAGRGVRSVQTVDRGRVPTLPGGRDPASDPLLRRFVRRELGEPGTMGRRDHVRTDPVSRTEIPRVRAKVGRGSCTAARRAAGRPRRPRSSTRTSTTARLRPARTRSISGPMNS